VPTSPNHPEDLSIPPHTINGSCGLVMERPCDSASPVPSPEGTARNGCTGARGVRPLRGVHLKIAHLDPRMRTRGNRHGLRGSVNGVSGWVGSEEQQRYTAVVVGCGNCARTTRTTQTRRSCCRSRRRR
jgi:hypothetical protein